MAPERDYLPPTPPRNSRSSRRTGMHLVRFASLRQKGDKLEIRERAERFGDPMRCWRSASFLCCCAAALVLSSVLSLIGCSHSAARPVTITFFDSEGLLHDLGKRRIVIDAALQEFTQDTGIQVNHLPG